MPRITFAALRIASRGAHDDIVRALDYAEINANDTIHAEHAATLDSFDDIALASICFTSPFSESSAVREWFARNGYTG